MSTICTSVIADAGVIYDRHPLFCRFRAVAEDTEVVEAEVEGGLLADVDIEDRGVAAAAEVEVEVEAIAVATARREVAAIRVRATRRGQAAVAEAGVGVGVGAEGASFAMDTLIVLQSLCLGR